jgi:lytic cellulose monooxygenase (C1-hydroxylating)
MKPIFISLFATFTSLANGHGGIREYKIDGVSYPGYIYLKSPEQTPLTTSNRYRENAARTIQRAWVKPNPIRDPSQPGVTCNTPGTPATHSAEVHAGSNVTAFWNSWPHNSGPLLVWMTECLGECSAFAHPQSSEWFKIFQGGLVAGTVGHGTWATTEMVRAGSSLTVRIPASLKAGNYLIRHETIMSVQV